MKNLVFTILAGVLLGAGIANANEVVENKVVKNEAKKRGLQIVNNGEKPYTDDVNKPKKYIDFDVYVTSDDCSKDGFKPNRKNSLAISGSIFHKAYFENGEAPTFLIPKKYFYGDYKGYIEVENINGSLNLYIFDPEYKTRGEKAIDFLKSTKIIDMTIELIDKTYSVKKKQKETE